MTDARKGVLLLACLVLTAAAVVVLLSQPQNRPADPRATAVGSQPESQHSRNPLPPSPDTSTTGDRSPQGTDIQPPEGGTSMRLTVPELARVENTQVLSAPGSEEGPLRVGAMHVAGTGFPWLESSNTYIAGHRLGFDGTPSDRLFWDLDTLQRGDEIVLHDADGRRYEYRVFGERIVSPDDISVAQPVPGKRLLSLQTCTLPDYTRRLVVQAELVSAPSPESADPNTPPAGAALTTPEDAFGVGADS